MKTPLLVLMCCLAFGAYAEEQTPSIGDRMKADASGFAGSVAKATKGVGTQIGTGTRKAAKSIQTKVKIDIRQGPPGNASARRQNETMDTAKAGRK